MSLEKEWKSESATFSTGYAVLTFDAILSKAGINRIPDVGLEVARIANARLGVGVAVCKIFLF